VDIPAICLKHTTWQITENFSDGLILDFKNNILFLEQEGWDSNLLHTGESRVQTLLGMRFIWTHPHRSQGPLSLPYNGHQVSFLQVKQPGLGADHPTTSGIKFQYIRAIHQPLLYACLAHYDIACILYKTMDVTNW
jgi:hypothetical protein